MLDNLKNCCHDSDVTTMVIGCLDIECCWLVVVAATINCHGLHTVRFRLSMTALNVVNSFGFRGTCKN